MTSLTPEPPSLGEKVAKAVADLVDTKDITWGEEGNWRGPHVLAKEDFLIPHMEGERTFEAGTEISIHKDKWYPGFYILKDGEIIPTDNVELVRTPSQDHFLKGRIKHRYIDKGKLIKKGRTAFLDLSEWDDLKKIPKNVTHYEVRDSGHGCYRGEVEKSKVDLMELGDTIPNHKIEPIQLLCYELLPYAAIHADIINKKRFFEGVAVVARISNGNGSAKWAEILTGKSLQSQPELRDLKSQRFKPGEIIVFYDNRGVGIHTVVGSGKINDGGEPLVYSLSQYPVPIPRELSIIEVSKTFYGGNEVAYAKSALFEG